MPKKLEDLETCRFDTGRIFRGNDKSKIDAITEYGSWVISNPQDVPADAETGLFRYAPQDQFCRFIPMDKIQEKRS